MIDLLTRAADAVDQYWFDQTSKHGNCIDASRVLTEVLRTFDIYAFCKPVKVQVWNAAGWEHRDNPTRLHIRDRPVGAGHTSEVGTDDTFNGHVVVYAKKLGTSDLWLVDATARQFGDPSEDRPIDSPVVVPLRELGPNTEQMLPAGGVTVSLAGGVQVVYEVMDPKHPQLLATDLSCDEAQYASDVAAVLESLV